MLKKVAVLLTAFASLMLPLAGSSSATTERSGTTGVSGSSAAPAATNSIFNGGDGGLGVIHLRDGSYTHGTHDALLPPGEFTDSSFGWGTTAGWYTGPGYCTRQWRSDGGGPYTQQTPNLGPGQHFIGSTTSYIVEAYRGTC